MPKIVRDLSILIAFCGAFYLLIILVRGETTNASTSSNFSFDRLEGDRSFMEKDWEQAILHFQKLVEKDKYNALAQAKLTDAKMKNLYEDCVQYMKLKKQGKLSQEEQKASRSDLRETASHCIEVQYDLIRFDNYRSRALRNLACLYTFIGKRDEAIKFLTQYVEGGSYIEGSIAFDAKLAPLREREDFQQLIKVERKFLPQYDLGFRERYYSR